MRGLGGLAGLAGINLGMDQKNILSPELYPEISQSLPYLLKVVNEPIYFNQSDTTVSPYTYFKEISKPTYLSYIFQYTIGLPALIKSKLSKKDQQIKTSGTTQGRLLWLSKDDNKFLKKFKDRIAVSVEEKTGIISISCRMPDAHASAELTDNCVSILSKFIVDYKIGQYQENLEFIQERYKEAERNYHKSQNELAIFTDQNRNVITSLANVEMQRLQNEFNVAFDVYKGLASQLEEARIRVKENTPVFTELEPIKIPIEKSAPQRKIILIMFFMTGLFLGFLYKFILNFLIS
jgi:hypothetical protein